MKRLALKITNKLLGILIILGFSFRISGKKNVKSSKEILSLAELVDFHFRNHSSGDHINRATMEKALSLLHNRPAVILETGSSAWGTNSSKLFDLYVKSRGGEFHTVDIRIDPLCNLYKESSVFSHFYCDDSVSFLKKWVKNHPNQKVDLVYLDSWDVNWKEPIPSAMHGLSEYFAISPALGKGSILIIDDSPANVLNMNFLSTELKNTAEQFYIKYGIMPGKGTLIDILLSKQSNARKIEHSYQIIYEFI